jgi:signal transduction histidine kinase
MLTVETPARLIPFNDSERLNKLKRFEILDTPEEEVFDKIARLAAEIFDTPSGFVTFVDKDRVFFKANISPLRSNQVPRAQSFCSIAILQEEITVINDTFQNPAFLDNPFVSAEGGIRFYAGAPLRSSDGYRLGTVCAIDSKPHEVTEKQIRMLGALSSMVMEELEQRERTKTVIRLHTDLINMAVHDLRQPVTSSLLYLQLMREQEDAVNVVEISSKVSTLIQRVDQKLTDLLNVSKIENGDLQLNLEKHDIKSIISEVIQTFELRAKQKNQRVTLIGEGFQKINVDKIRVIEIFENLLGNALKYSNVDTETVILITKEENFIVVEFRDQGLGLDEEDMKKLFIKFAKLSSIPTGKERSNGLGLSIVKILAELHLGKTWATSAGKNKGSSFFVSFPC